MEPLASKIRPKNLEEFVGQEHLVGEGKPLNVAISLIPDRQCGFYDFRGIR